MSDESRAIRRSGADPSEVVSASAQRSSDHLIDQRVDVEWSPDEDEQPALFPELGRAPNREYTTGILASQHIEDLIARKWLEAAAPIDPGQIQPASVDLRLGPTAYRVQASFLPGKRGRVMNRVNDFLLETLDLTATAVLRRGEVYIVPLMETLSLGERYSAKANPKSTTGRLDIFTRLITDYADEFETVSRAYKGPLYVEVVPKTFDVRVSQGTRLNQLRIIRGEPRPADGHLRRLHEEIGLLFSETEKSSSPDIERGLGVRVDLAARDGAEIVGYKAKNSAPIVDLARVGYYDPADFWDPVRPSRRNSIILEPNDFYILVSKERVRVPLTHAADMVPYDTSIGEFRVHYAGFFDPGFGLAGGSQGTPAVLEVRSHEVPFVLEDGQLVARLVYEQMLEVPLKVYGANIGSSYQSQGLTLSKQFRAIASSAKET